MQITPSQLRRWDACWPDDEIQKYFGDRVSLPISEILADSKIPLRDRYWLVINYICELDPLWLLDFTTQQVIELLSPDTSHTLAAYDKPTDWAYVVVQLKPGNFELLKQKAESL